MQKRNRIALELHDSVAQSVLSAGLTVDVCQRDLHPLPGGPDLAAQLGCAKDLIRKAAEQLRSAIYALQHGHGTDNVADGAGLPELLQEMASQHGPRLAVTVRIEGQPVPLGAAMEHSLARTAGEALFNVSMHACAHKATVRLRYAADAVHLSVSDDGAGDPATLRRLLRVAMTTTAGAAGWPTWPPGPRNSAAPSRSAARRSVVSASRSECPGRLTPRGQH